MSGKEMNIDSKMGGFFPVKREYARDGVDFLEVGIWILDVCGGGEREKD